MKALGETKIREDAVAGLRGELPQVHNLLFSAHTLLDKS